MSLSAEIYKVDKAFVKSVLLGLLDGEIEVKPG